MIEQILEQAKHQWLNVGSVIGLLIIIPIRSWTRNRALGKLKKQFSEDEYIVYEPSLPFIIEFFAPLQLGGSTLELILSHDLPPVHIAISIFFTIVVFFLIFWLSCIKYGLTNIRIFCVPSFDFMYKFKKLLGVEFFELNISDINSVNQKKYPTGYIFLEIETKNGKKPLRLMFDNMDEIQSKIDDQILLSNTQQKELIC